MDKTEDISYRIKLTKENLRHIPSKGIGYGILKYLTTEDNKEGLDFNLNPEIIFNYLGQTDETVNTDTFEFSPITYGNAISSDSKRQYVFELSGIIVNGELVFTLNYNKFEYSKKTVEYFMKFFRERLLEIIEHCMNKEEIELTPSDLINDSLSLEELDEIYDTILEL